MHSKILPYSAMILSLLTAIFLSAYYWLESERIHKLIFYASLLPLPIILWGRRSWEVLRQPIICALVAYLLYQGVSLQWNPLLGFEEAGEWLRKSLLITMFLLVVKHLFLKMEERGVFIFALITALSSAASLLWIDIESLRMGRLIGYGMAENAVQSGILYGIAAIVAYYGLLNYGATSYRLIFAIALITLLAGLLMTQSRGAMVALILSCGFLFTQQRLTPRMWLLFSLGACGAFALIGWHYDWQSLVERLDGYRFTIWEAALSSLSATEWLIGKGFRTPFELTLPYGETIYQTHSIYVAALYQGGALGLLALLTLFGTAIYTLWQNRYRGDAKLWLALSINAMVLGLFDFDLLITGVSLEWLVFWLPIAGALAVHVESCRTQFHEAAYPYSA
jgi:O-antigen ligase